MRTSWLNRKTIIKILFFLVGVFINSFGIVMITKANLGTSQISSIAYVFSLGLESLDFGMATFLLNVGFLIVQLIILKSKTDGKILAQLPVSFLLGFFININMAILSSLNPSRLIMKFLYLILGCIILGFGISIEVSPDIVKIPGEGVVDTISKVYRIRFGKVKVVFDLILVSLALVISYIIFGKIIGIGIGTVVSALIVGRIVNIFDRKLENFYRKVFI